MKIKLELNIVGDKKFLNFWNPGEGKDVTGEIVKDGWVRINFLSENNPNLTIAHTISEFVDEVLKSIE